MDTLDNLLAAHSIGVDEVGVVWMDCQGFEGYILAGAPAVMAQGVPVICEYWPAGLRDAGDLDLFHRQVADHYDVVIDIRSPAEPGSEPRSFPASEIGRLASIYDGLAHTDLLLLRDGSA